MLTDQQLIEKYLAIKDFVTAEKERFKSHIGSYENSMEIIEGELLRRLNERQSENTRTDAGTAYKSTTLKPKVSDRDKFLAFVDDNWDVWGSEMLLASPQVDAVKQWIDHSRTADNPNGTPPPGVDVSYYTRVNIRRS